MGLRSRFSRNKKSSADESEVYNGDFEMPETSGHDLLTQNLEDTLNCYHEVERLFTAVGNDKPELQLLSASLSFVEALLLPLISAGEASASSAPEADLSVREGKEEDVGSSEALVLIDSSFLGTDDITCGPERRRAIMEAKLSDRGQIIASTRNFLAKNSAFIQLHTGATEPLLEKLQAALTTLQTQWDSIAFLLIRESEKLYNPTLTSPSVTDDVESLGWFMPGAVTHEEFTTQVLPRVESLLHQQVTSIGRGERLETMEALRALMQTFSFVDISAFDAYVVEQQAHSENASQAVYYENLVQILHKLQFTLPGGVVAMSFIQLEQSWQLALLNSTNNCGGELFGPRNTLEVNLLTMLTESAAQGADLPEPMATQEEVYRYFVQAMLSRGQPQLAAMMAYCESLPNFSYVDFANTVFFEGRLRPTHIAALLGQTDLLQKLIGYADNTQLGSNQSSLLLDVNSANGLRVIDCAVIGGKAGLINTLVTAIPRSLLFRAVGRWNGAGYQLAHTIAYSGSMAAWEAFAPYLTNDPEGNDAYGLLTKKTAGDRQLSIFNIAVDAGHGALALSMLNRLPDKLRKTVIQGTFGQQLLAAAAESGQIGFMQYLMGCRYFPEPSLNRKVNCSPIIDKEALAAVCALIRESESSSEYVAEYMSQLKARGYFAQETILPMGSEGRWGDWQWDEFDNVMGKITQGAVFSQPALSRYMTYHYVDRRALLHLVEIAKCCLLYTSPSPRDS